MTHIDGPRTRTRPEPMIRPLGESKATRARRTIPVPASIASDATARLQATARDNQSWDRYVEAIIGRDPAELSIEEGLQLDRLRDEIMSGRIAPTFIFADGDLTSLPDAVRGAYVPSREKGRAGSGTVVLKPKMSEGQTRATADEELSEAVVTRARQLGLPVARGDAGARGAAAIAGETVTRAENRGAFRATRNDTATIAFDGKLYTVAADIGGPNRSAVKAFMAYDGNGTGVLGETEFYNAIEGMNYARGMGEKFLKLYGTYHPLASASGLSTWTLSKAQLENVDQDVFGVNTGNGMQFSFVEVSGEAWADGFINVIAERYKVSPNEIREKGLTPEEMDWATDRLLGDRKRVDKKNRIVLAKTFATVFTDGTYRFYDTQLASLFESRALELFHLAPDDIRGYLPFNVDTSRRPALTQTTDLVRYFMNFDGSDGSTRDGRLTSAEMRNAAIHYAGDTHNGNDGLLLAAFNRLSIFFGSQDSMTREDLAAAADAGILVAGQSAYGREMTVDFTTISPQTARDAIWKQIASGRGVPVAQVGWVTRQEFRDAASSVSRGALSDQQIEDIFDEYGVLSTSRNEPMINAQHGLDLFTEGRLTVLPSGYLSVDEAHTKLFGHPSPDKPIVTTEPYDVEQLVSTQPGRYGREKPDGTKYSYATGQTAFGSSSLGLVSAVTSKRTMEIVVPFQAMDPHHGQPGVYNPPEYRTIHTYYTHLFVNDQKRFARVVPTMMTRTVTADPNVVTWDVQGITRNVHAGSKLDQYLSDYVAFSTPSSAQHLAGNPNLQMVRSQVIPETGETLEIWAPRDHQFSTDQNGNAVEIAEEPRVVVRDAAGNARVIEYASVHVGTSAETGESVWGIKIPEKAGFPGAPSTGQFRNLFMTLDDTTTPAARRAIEQLNRGVGIDGRIFYEGPINMSPTNTTVPVTESDDDYTYDPAVLGRKGVAGDKARRSARSSVVEEVKTMVKKVTTYAADVATRTVAEKLAADRASSNGVLVRIDAAIKMGLAEQADKTDRDQYIQIEVTPEVRQRLTEYGFSGNAGMRIDYIREEFLKKNEGRGLQQAPGPEGTEANPDGDGASEGDILKWGYFFVGRGHHTRIIDGQKDYLLTPDDSDGPKYRIQTRFKYNSLVLKGLPATATGLVQGTFGATKAPNEVAFSLKGKAKAVAVFSVRVGRDQQIYETLGVRGYLFVEGNVGMTWEAGGGYDSAADKVGSWSLATEEDSTLFGPFLGNFEARLRVYTKSGAGLARIISVASMRPETPIVGGEIRFQPSWNKGLERGAFPNLMLSFRPVVIYSAGSSSREAAAAAVTQGLLSAAMGIGYRWLIQSFGGGNDARMVAGAATSGAVSLFQYIANLPRSGNTGNPVAESSGAGQAMEMVPRSSATLSTTTTAFGNDQGASTSGAADPTPFLNSATRGDPTQWEGDVQASARDIPQSEMNEYRGDIGNPASGATEMRGTVHISALDTNGNGRPDTLVASAGRGLTTGATVGPSGEVRRLSPEQIAALEGQAVTFDSAAVEVVGAAPNNQITGGRFDSFKIKELVFWTPFEFGVRYNPYPKIIVPDQGQEL